jgi:hypothetical protein
MFSPHRPLISVPAFPSSAHCVRRLPRSGRGVSAFSSLLSFCRGGSSDACFSPIPDSLEATISFRIIFFAHPHHLIPIESYSCKKQGRGGHPAPPSNPFLFFPQRVNIPTAATSASPIFSCVYLTRPVTRGVAWDSQLFSIASLSRDESWPSSSLYLPGLGSRITGPGTPTTPSPRGSANSASAFTPTWSGRYPFPRFPSQVSSTSTFKHPNAAFPLLTTHYSLRTIHHSRSSPELLPSRPQSTA